MRQVDALHDRLVRLLPEKVLDALIAAEQPLPIVRLRVRLWEVAERHAERRLRAAYDRLTELEAKRACSTA